MTDCSSVNVRNPLLNMIISLYFNNRFDTHSFPTIQFTYTTPHVHTRLVSVRSLYDALHVEWERVLYMPLVSGVYMHALHTRPAIHGHDKM